MGLGLRPDVPFEPTFQGLLRLPPKPQLIAGLLMLAAGSVCTVLLWERGFVWGLTLFGIVAGLLLSISGAAGLRSLAKRRKILESLAARKEEILTAMIEAKRQGKNPIRWLNEQGILDAEARTWLLEEMNARLKPEEPLPPSRRA